MTIGPQLSYKLELSAEYATNKASVDTAQLIKKFILNQKVLISRDR